MASALLSSCRPLVAPLLLAALPLVQGAGSGSSSAAAGSSSGHGSGDHPPWYKHEYEYNYVESVILIVLVIIALTFEHCWHMVNHLAQHSYRYGQLHDMVNNDDGQHRDEHGNLTHQKLYKVLVNRAGSEFMTLGVLAFCTFMFNNAGGFQAMDGLYKTEDAISLPKSSSDWLHMVEIVHMKLFVGMLLYFALQFAMCRSGVVKIRLWESCRLRRLKDLGTGQSVRSFEKLDTDLAQYILWRDYFIACIVMWKKRRPALFKDVLAKLNIDPEDPDAEKKVRKQVESRFAFSGYLALNVGEGIIDSIHVSSFTWFCLLALFAMFSLLHRYAKANATTLTWFFLGAILVLVFGMGMVVKRVERNINRFMQGRHREGDETTVTRVFGAPLQDDGHEGLETGRSTSAQTMDSAVSEITNVGNRESFHQRYNTELLFVRVLQIVLFLLSYTFARTLMDFHEWELYPQRTTMAVAMFVIVFIVLTAGLNTWVPGFLALMSLPPYVDEGNLAHFFGVLLDDHEIHTGSTRASLSTSSSTLGEVDDSSGQLACIKPGGPEAVSALVAELKRLEARLGLVEMQVGPGGSNDLNNAIATGVVSVKL